jgi:hypothetical protein
MPPIEIDMGPIQTPMYKELRDNFVNACKNFEKVDAAYQNAGSVMKYVRESGHNKAIDEVARAGDLLKGYLSGSYEKNMKDAKAASTHKDANMANFWKYVENPPQKINMEVAVKEEPKKEIGNVGSETASAIRRNRDMLAKAGKE